jgi:hypothetical protein
MKINILCILATIGLFFSACKKDTYTNPQPLLSSVTVVNATTGLGAIYFNQYTTGLVYATKLDSIIYKGMTEYGVPSGTVSLKIVSSRDTTKQILNGSFTIDPSKLYSLYVAGNQSGYEAIFNTETNIPRYTDSAVAIRVINISSNSPAVNVTLRATPAVNEFSNLAYKQQSSFNKYPLTSVNAATGYIFDVRNATDNSLLASYSFLSSSSPTIQAARFKAITLVISGRFGATSPASDAYTVFAIKNY